MKRQLLFLALSLASLVAHAQTPTLNWEARYNNSPVNTKDEWVDIEVDAQGNSYLIGKSIGQGTGYDIVVSKVSNTGNVDWTIRRNGTANSYDEGVDIELDGNGNMYCIGNITNTNQGLDGILFKLHADSVQEWARWYNNGSVNATDKFNSLAVSNDGTRIAIGGETFGTGSNTDYLYVIFNQFGDIPPLLSYTPLSSNNQSVKLVEFFNNNNIAFISQDSTFYAPTSISNGTQMLIDIRSATNWNVVDVTYANPDYEVIRPIATCKNLQDEILILAESQIDNTNPQKTIQLYKTGSGGTLNSFHNSLINFTWDPETTGVNDFYLTDVAVNDQGLVYISGSYDTNPSNSLDMTGFVLALNSDFTQRWFREILNSEVAAALFPDNLNYSSVYVAVTHAAGGTQDITTYKLGNDDGLTEWVVLYAGPDAGADIAQFIHVANDGAVRVGGMSHSTANDNDAILLKYCIPPTVNFSTLSAVCVNAASVTLSGGSPLGGTYSGTGVTNGLFNPLTAGVGTHTITYEATQNGCSATATRTITVHPTPPQPSISNTGSLQFCNGGSVMLSAPANYTYDWNPGTGASQTLQVSATGNYTVTVTDQNGCQSTSAATAVTVYANPTVSITGQNYFCFGSTTSLSANALAGSGSISGYQWLLNNEPIGGSISANYSASAMGNYSVTVTNSNNCSTTSQVFAVSEALPPTVPTATVSGALEFCEGESVLLSAVAPNCVGCNFEWQNDGQLAGTGTTFTVTQSGEYIVIASNNCGEEASVSAIFVIVNSLPTADAGNDETICAEESLELQGSGSGDCAWLPVIGLSEANSCFTNATPPNSTNYILSVTDPITGCLNRDTVYITVISGQAPVPQFNYELNGNTVVFELQNDSDYDQVTWIFGDGDSSNVFDPVHSYANGAVGSIVRVIGCINCSDTVLCSPSEQLLTVGIDEYNQFGVLVSPNPTSSMLSVNLERSEGNYEIYDAVGKRMSGAAITSRSFVVDMSNYSSGLYLLVIQSKGQRVQRNIIRQ